MSIRDDAIAVPTTLEDLILPKRLMDIVNKWIESGRLETCSFFGDAGKGKTSLARFLGEHLDYNVMEVDASKMRSVTFIEDSLDPFLTNHSGDIRPKLVIMDECEMLSEYAVKSLKKSVEDQARIHDTVFIFITNEYHKMDATILSRAPALSFDHESYEELLDIQRKLYARIRDLFKKNNVKFNKDNLMAYVKDKSPDIRATFNSINNEVIDGTFMYMGNSYLSNSYMEIIQKISSESPKFAEIMQWLSDQSCVQPSKIINKLYSDICQIIDDRENELLPEDRSCIIDVIKILSDYSYKISHSTNPQITMRAMMIELCEETSLKVFCKIDFKRYTTNELC